MSQDEDNIYIATNDHVVSGAETLTITFSDGTSASANIEGTDSSMDLAVVSVPLDDLSAGYPLSDQGCYAWRFR